MADNRDPAASMALLRELVRDDAAQEYAEAARRHRSEPPRAGTRALLLLSVALVAGVLTLALVQNRAVAPEKELARQALVERAQATQQRIADLEASIATTRSDLAAAQEVLLAQSQEGQALADLIAALEQQAGYTAVAGPGVVVVLDDAPSAAGGGPDDPGRVLDQDVVLAVNGLWLAGAEAVAVNGVRLTSTTAIRGAGQAILVDFRPLVPPYRVEAIGAPDDLLARFRASASALGLAAVAEEYGISVTTEQRASVELAASTALLPVRARVPRPLGATVGTSPAPATSISSTTPSEAQP